MLLSTIPVHSGRNFLWQGSFKATAEMSQLSDGGRRRHATRVWDDSADYGFWVESQRTGNRVLFTLTKEYRNSDNEVTHWDYTSGASIQPSPIVITVYNT